MDASRRVVVFAPLVVAASLAACGPSSRPLISGDILLFTGTGTSAGDVAALQTILDRNRFEYSTVNSSQLNQMDEQQLRRYRLLIVPGGNFIQIGNSLSASTASNIRTGVQDGL